MEASQKEQSQGKSFMSFFCSKALSFEIKKGGEEEIFLDLSLFQLTSAQETKHETTSILSWSALMVIFRESGGSCIFFYFFFKKEHYIFLFKK